MATRTWTGDAVAVKDKWTITVANTWAAADTGTITIDGNDLVVTIGSLVTTAEVATTLKQAYESEAFTDTTASCTPSGGGTSIPQMSAITATVSGSTVILTADTAGVPHTISVSESTAGTGTLAIAHTTTATGPNYFDNADNWAEGSVPITGDEVYFDRPVSLLYALDQNAITLDSLEISPLFSSSAQIGLPFRNAAGYEEYREDYFKISVTALTVNTGSGRIKLNVGSALCTANIYATGTTLETGRSAFQFLGTHASNVMNVYGGDVGIASNLGEAATVLTLKQASGTVTCGASATLTTINKQGGTLTVASNVTTLTSESGATTISGGTTTTATIHDGAVTVTDSATITTLRQYGGTVTSGVNATLTNIAKAAGTLSLYSSTSSFTTEAGTTNIYGGTHALVTVGAGTVNLTNSGTITSLRQYSGAVIAGPQATVSAAVKTSGTLSLYSNSTSILSEGGTVTLNGGTHTLITSLAGTVAATNAAVLTELRMTAGTCTIDANCTATTINKEGGTLTSRVGITTLVSHAGATTVTAGNITSASILGGTFAYKGAGTITAINVDNCTLDFSGTTAGCTVTTINEVGRPITISDPTDRVTWTNGLPTGRVIKYTAT